MRNVGRMTHRNTFFCYDCVSMKHDSPLHKVIWSKDERENVSRGRETQDPRGAVSSSGVRRPGLKNRVNLRTWPRARYSETRIRMRFFRNLSREDENSFNTGTSVELFCTIYDVPSSRYTLIIILY